MTMPPLSRPARRLLAVSILLLVLLLGWSAVVAPLIALVEAPQADIAALSEELRGLNAILARGPVLEQTARRLRTRLAAQASGWRGSSPTAVAANIQNLVRQAVLMNGGQFRSTSEVHAPGKGAAQRVAIQFQMEGPIEALQKTLEAIEAARPSLFIDSVTVSAPAWGANRNQRPNLAITIGVTALTELPPS